MSNFVFVFLPAMLFNTCALRLPVDFPQCSGFPKRTSKKLHLTQPQMLLSISMFERPWYLRATLENALAHTANDTLILLHLNANQVYPQPDEKDSDFEWIFLHPRIEVNCDRIRIPGSWHGEIAQSHLWNLKWARKRGIRSPFVVYQASNMWWVRKGMEAHVRTKKSSVPRITTSQQCDVFDRGYANGYSGCVDLDLHVDSSLHNEGLVGAENHSQTSFLELGFVDRCFVPPFEGLTYLVQRKHEGSYYPTADIYRMIDYLDHLLEQQGKVEQLVAQRASLHCQNKNRAIAKEIYTTAWPLEEIMIQSWMANFGESDTSGDVLFKEFTEDAVSRGCGAMNQHVCSSPHPAYAVKLHKMRDDSSQGKADRTWITTCGAQLPC